MMGYRREYQVPMQCSVLDGGGRSSAAVSLASRLCLWRAASQIGGLAALGRLRVGKVAFKRRCLPEHGREHRTHDE